MEQELIDSILHDYREDYFESKQERGRIKQNRWHEFEYARSEWKKTNVSNTLRRTLIYELTYACRGVEDKEIVKKKAFSIYCKNYNDIYTTADIMNGWWYCFQTIFARKESKSITRKEFRNKYSFECEADNPENNNYNERIGQIDGICEFMSLQPEYDVLCKYLSIVYSVGNMTPAPINPGGRGYGSIDFWEYKLLKYGKLYHDHNGDRETLYFQDYKDFDIKESYHDYIKNLADYMNSRIDLILKRAYRIIKKHEISTSELEDLKKKLCT